MNRRDVSILLTAFAAAPSLAFAADGTAEQDHAAKTLAAGSVSLETSKLAQSKATDPWVKKFADYEVAEQETIAEILKSMGAAPAQKNEKQQAALDKLKSSKSFDKDYLSV